MSAEQPLSTADIDALCDRFEQQYKGASQNGSRPRIEDFLSGLQDTDRQSVLRELLFIDHQYRLQAGEAVAEEEYRRRFPEDDFIVDEVLSQGVGHDCDTQLHEASDPTSRNAADDDYEKVYETLLEALPAGDDDDAVGPTLGDYELLDELGRGGMGIVFRARQKSVDRLVALKILRKDKLNELPEDDQATMIERFRTESQSAAQLEHDHIVPVFEVGEADGIYFYSMRYVQGESLAEVIAEHPLDNHSTAQAIEPIARALQAAHARGVLHRDIKPRNIMIDDGTGRPLLTDFGLAKLLESGSDMTHTGDVMGSPPYMSPEQATDAAHVTEAADIYSLGATMYHALTGRAPFQAATVAETLRQVWFEDPPTPRRLNPAIDADLETICLKCLDKDPSRRFESAGELADELARYLRGEAIHSRPIGTLGRLQRWRRRNPMVANLAGMLALSIVVGFAAVVYYAIQLQQSLADARERLDVAVNAVDHFTDMATEEDGLKAYGVDEVRREMLSASREYYDRFVELETDDPLLEEQRGKAYGRLADIEADLGNQDAAIGLYQQAVEVFARMELKFPKNPNYTYLRAAYLSNVANVQQTVGRLDEAETTLGQAYELASDLHDRYPTTVEYAALLAQIHGERGVLYKALGQANKAELSRLETVNLWEQIVNVEDTALHRHQLAISHNAVAEFYRTEGDRDNASGHYEQAMEIWRVLTQEHPIVSSYAAGLATCEFNLGNMHLNAGELDKAEALLRSAEHRRRLLAEKHSQLPQYQEDLANSLDSVGQLLHLRDDLAGAAMDYRMALSYREDLRNRFPGVPKYEVAYAASQMNLGDLYRDERRYAQAAGCFRIALDVLQSIVDDNPQTTIHSEYLAGAHFNLALVLRREAKFTEAVEHCNQAISIQQRLAASQEDSLAQRFALANSYDLLSQIQEDQGELQAAAETYQTLIALREEILADDESLANVKLNIARNYLGLAAIKAALSEFDLAESALTAAIEILLHLEDDESETAQELTLMAHAARAEVRDELGRHSLAVGDWDQILLTDPRPLFHLRRAVSLARSGEHAAAVALLENAEFFDADNAGGADLRDAACVFSRAAEAAEADSSLDEGERAEAVNEYLDQGVQYLQTYLDRIVSPQKEIIRQAVMEQLRQDRDLARLRMFESCADLLQNGGSSKPD